MGKDKKEFTYYVIVYPDYSITGKANGGDFDTKKELIDFLEVAGYDTKDKEISELINNGGEYKGLNAPEFKIELIPVEVEEEEEIEQTPFNNAELFIEEYKDYLSGKNISVGTDSRYNIHDMVAKNEDVNILTSELKSKEKTSFILYQENFQNFIDGDVISQEGDMLEFSLILQEEKESEPKPELYNKPEFKYYVICNDGKVLSGFEYKEDAEKEKQRLEKYLRESKVKAKKDLSNIDLDNNENWSVNEHDWDIIRIAINQGVEDNEYSQKRADELFNNFKEKQMSVHGIKARLMYLLKMLQDSTRKAFINSNVELATDKCDLTCRVQKELRRVIEMER